jgi:hypothetical protein
MKCHEVTELMQRDLDKDLNDIEHGQLQSHVQNCANCKVIYERMKFLSAELESLPKVSPAYSIVDSILPVLDRIDMEQSDVSVLASQEKGHELKAASHKLGWKTYWSRKNWKMAGGVIAAGIAFGLILVNTGLNNDMDQADGFLQPRMNAANEAASGSSGGSPESKGAMHDKAADGTQLEGTAEDQSQMEFEATEEADTFIADESTSQETMDIAVTSEDNLSTQSKINENEGFAGSEEDTMTESIIENEIHENFTIQENAPMESMKVEEDSSANKIQSTQEYSITRSDIEIAEPFSSPNGSLTAYVEGQIIIIVDSTNQNPVFQTEAKNADQIMNLKWSNDSELLHYETATGESIARYEINIKLKTDSQIN